MTKPPLVGREQEMAQLAWALDEALAGRGRIVLLAGEPGIGKSRLAEEIATVAAAAGAVVAWGTAWESDAAPSFWPFIQLLRTLPIEGDEHGELARILPELGRPATEAGGKDSHYRLFAAVADALRKGARSTPMVAILDDLQWADPDSLQLLSFVARDLPTSRILIVATYRDTEIRPALAEAIDDLAHQIYALPIFLSGLASAPLARLIEFSSGTDLTDDQLAALVRRAGGNPFFAAQIARLPDEEESERLPVNVVQAISRRMARLSSETRDLLTICAVAGPQFDIDLVASITQKPYEDALALLEPAIAARLIGRDAKALGGFSFAHDLIRETVYESLGLSARARLHDLAGAALERRFAGNESAHASELAYHFLQAAEGGFDRGRAVDFAQAAGRQAVDRLAYEDAARWFARALQALDQVADVAPERRCDLLLSLAEARYAHGDVDGCREAAFDAAEIARVLGDAEKLARAALDYGSGWVPGGQPLIDLLEEALSLYGPPETETTAMLCARLGSVLNTEKGPSEESTKLLDRAVAAADSLGGHQTAAYVLNQILDTLVVPELTPHLRETAARLLHHAEEAGNLELQVEAHGASILAGLQLGALGDVERHFEPHAALARRLGQTHQLWDAAGIKAMRATLAGSLDEAERLAAEARELGRRGHDQAAANAYFVQLLLIYRERGARADLDDRVVALRMPLADSAAAFLHAEQGRGAEAERVLDRIAGAEWLAHSHVAQRMAALALAAEAAARVGHRASADALYPALLPHAHLCVVYGWASAFLGSVSYYLGLLATTLGNAEEASRHHADALVVHESMPAPLWAARSRRALEGPPPAVSGGKHPLTARELEIVRLLARGMSNDEIADKLFITHKTVKHHVSSILAKLGVADRTQAAVYALREGLAE